MPKNLRPKRTSPEVTTVLAGGEMGERIRAYDWAGTELGPLHAWPQSLLTALSICLASRFPMVLWWGPRLRVLYNDAYIPISGAKHPRLLGAPGELAWPEMWEVIGPMLAQVMQKGESLESDDQMFSMHRHGYHEETYFTWSYSPIRAESGMVGGVFTAVAETTPRVLEARRLRTLQELAANTIQARSVERACALVAETLVRNSADVPFAMIYLADDARHKLVLHATVGVEPGTPAAPREVPTNAPATTAWPLAEVLSWRQFLKIENIENRFGRMPGGAWPESPHTAVVLPIASTDEEKPKGVLVMGINPRRAFDDDYRRFIELVSGQIAATLSNAKTHEEERNRAEALAEIDRAKTAFFSNVSHEFRTPLTLMLGPLEEALNNDTFTPEQRRRLELVDRNARCLLKLVNTLLDFSRIEAGRAQAVYELTDIAELTARLASVFRAAIEQAGLTLIVDTPPIDAPVYVDPEMWEKVVLNLLSNAFKFTFEGEIEVALKRIDDRVELRVRDTGTGIPEAELPRIFERFYRVEGARGRTHAGTGIGLALIQELVKLHGGAIGVDSRLGAGSTFTVTIPLGDAHLASHRLGARRAINSTVLRGGVFVEEALHWPEEGFSQTAATAIPQDKRARVLIVDDNADMRNYLRALLEQFCVTETAGDGEAAYAAILEDPPDLVLSDVMMPRLDGFGLVRKLRQNPTTKNLPIILLSARAETRVEGLEVGADDYLLKPFSAKRLTARVKTCIELARLRAEADAERRKLAFLIDNVPVILWAVDRDGVYISSEGKGLAAIGLKSGQIVGRSYFEIHKDEPALVENVKRALRGEGFIADTRVQQRWFQTQYSPVRDASGEVLGMVGVSTDITQHKQAQDALNESERMFTTLIANLSGAAYRCENAPGRPVTYASHGIFELTGYTAAEFMARKFTDIISPDEIESMERDVQQALSQRKSFTLIYRIRHTSGEDRWVWDRGQGVYAPDGTVAAIEGFASDLTELMRTRSELKVSRERFNLVMESVDLGFWYWDIPSGKRIWSNKVKEHLGIPADAEPASDAFYESLHPDDRQRVREAIHKAVQARSPFDLEYRTVNSSTGDVKWIHSIGRCFYDPNGKPLHFDGVTLDVTEKHKTEELLFQARRLESVGVLAGGIAHDFNNILTAVLGNIALAKLHHAADPTTTDILSQAEQASLRARDLTQQLLTFSKGGAPVKKPGWIADLLREAADFALHGSKVRPVLDIAPDLWPAVFDAGQMSQVINNLLINAVQAMPGGGTVTLSARNRQLGAVNSYQLRSGRFLHIRVKDEGTGIPAEHLSRVFDPYFTTKQTGTGLGLATSYSIIKRHEGYIGVASKMNKGTTFTILIPAAEGAALPAPAGAAALHPGHGRILLMDDEAGVRQVGATLLKRLGYDVTVAVDGDHAIAQYKWAMSLNRRFDLVILDLTVPAAMGGKECIKKLYEIDPKVKAIVSSGYSADPVMADYVGYAFAGVIAKPYKLEDFSEMVHRVLQGQH